jgi:Uma2 family endonuclease
MSAVLSDRMTLDEFHALPDDPSVERMLLFGQLVERPMTKRNKWHAGAEAAIAGILRVWNRSQTPRPGKVYSGEVGCDFPEIETGVGIDVAFVGNELLQAQADNQKYIVGAPILVVEVLSLSDVVEDVHRRVKAFLAAGVKQVWVVDPYDHTLTVHRPGTPPVMFTSGKTFHADPDLPGLAVHIDEVFE